DIPWRWRESRPWLRGCDCLLAGVIDAMVPAREFVHRDPDAATTLEVVTGLLGRGARLVAGRARLAWRSRAGRRNATALGANGAAAGGRMPGRSRARRFAFGPWRGGFRRRGKGCDQPFTGQASVAAI